MEEFARLITPLPPMRMQFEAGGNSITRAVAELQAQQFSADRP
jgi:hypothetical protein